MNICGTETEPRALSCSRSILPLNYLSSPRWCQPYSSSVPLKPPVTFASFENLITISLKVAYSTYPLSCTVIALPRAFSFPVSITVPFSSSTSSSFSSTVYNTIAPRLILQNTAVVIWHLSTFNSDTKFYLI